MFSLFIHSPDACETRQPYYCPKSKLLALTSQTKLTLTLNPKTKLTLQRGTNPTKP